MSQRGPTSRVPPAALYLASAEDAEDGRREVAGLPIAFRALMVALRAGCPTVAVPSVFRGTEVEQAIERSERARANTVWLNGGSGDTGTESLVLLPSTVVLSPVALRALLQAPPLGMLSAAPIEAPVALADRSVVAAVQGQVVAGRPAGGDLCAALLAGGAGVARGGWCVRATSRTSRKDAERRLYAELGSAIDTRLDRLLHRPLSRHLTRAAVALGVPPNPISLASLTLGLFAAWCLARATVESGLLGIALYFAAAVLDHVDGEVARLTYAESRFGEWLDVAVDTVVHASIALAMGVAAERIAGTGLGLGAVAAIGFALSALSAKTSAGGDDVRQALTRLGSRDGFYLLLVAFFAQLSLAPATLPALLLLTAVGSHVYWLGQLAVRFRHILPRGRLAR